MKRIFGVLGVAGLGMGLLAATPGRKPEFSLDGIDELLAGGHGSEALHRFQDQGVLTAEEQRAYSLVLGRLGYGELAVQLSASEPHEVTAVIRGYAALRSPQGFAFPQHIDAGRVIPPLRAAMSKMANPAQHALMSQLLEVGPDGVLGHGDLRAAAAEGVLARGVTHPDEIAGLLLRAGDLPGLQTFVGQSDVAEVRAWWLVNETLQRPAGVEAAMGALNLSPEEQRTVVDSAEHFLHRSRLYDEARDLVARFPGAPHLDHAYDHRYETADFASPTPETAVRRYLRAQIDPAWQSRFSSFVAGRSEDLHVVVPFPYAQVPYLDRYLDERTSRKEVAISGNEHDGWRVRWSRGDGKNWTLFVISEEGQPRVFDDGVHPEVLAREAGRRFDAGDLDSARVWLDRAYQDPDHPRLPEYAAIWPLAGDRSPEAAQLAIAAFAATSSRGARWLPVLRQGWAASPHRAALGRRLAAAEVGVRDWAGALAVVARLEASGESADPLIGPRVRALAELGRTAEAEALARAAVPDRGVDTILVAAIALADAEDFEGAVRVDELALAAFPDDLDLLNDLVWDRMFLPRREGLADLARRLAAGAWDTEKAHTAACALALEGYPDEARVIVWQYTVGHFGNVDGDWALPWALIATADGYPDEARKAYTRIPPEPRAVSAYALSNRLRAPG